jgi:probable rRNA maturation factor
MKRDARPSSGKLEIHVAVASRAWTRKLRTAAACARRAATAAIIGAAGGSRNTMEISILLATDHALRRLNHDFRGIDKPTNVLSFLAHSPDDEQIPGAPVLLGDVAVAYGVSEREARGAGKSFAAHLSHLVVHGVLHLLGYDHQRDRDALKMEKLETKILAGLGITDPYTEIPNKFCAPKKTRAHSRKNPARKRVRK